MPPSANTEGKRKRSPTSASGEASASGDYSPKRRNSGEEPAALESVIMDPPLHGVQGSPAPTQKFGPLPRPGETGASSLPTAPPVVAPPEGQNLSSLSFRPDDQTINDPPTSDLPVAGGEEESPSADRPKGPPAGFFSDPFAFLLSHPYLEKLREASNQDSQDVAQEAVSSLLHAGCLFAQVAQRSQHFAEVAELRQEVEKLRSDNLRANNTCTKLAANWWLKRTR